MTEKSNMIWNNPIWLVIFAIFGFVIATISIKSSKSPSVERIQVVYDINDPFSEQKVLDYLKELHVKYPNIAIAQMKLESANGTSLVFREGNNLFGMKMAEKRPTTALGTRNNHAYYNHWRQSVIDYALWQSFVSNPENISSEEEWLNYVGRMYAEDNSYRKKLVIIRDSLIKK